MSSLTDTEILIKINYISELFTPETHIKTIENLVKQVKLSSSKDEKGNLNEDVLLTKPKSYISNSIMIISHLFTQTYVENEGKKDMKSITPYEENGMISLFGFVFKLISILKLDFPGKDSNFLFESFYYSINHVTYKNLFIQSFCNTILDLLTMRNDPSRVFSKIIVDYISCISNSYSEIKQINQLTISNLVNIIKFSMTNSLSELIESLGVVLKNKSLMKKLKDTKNSKGLLTKLEFFHLSANETGFEDLSQILSCFKEDEKNYSQEITLISYVIHEKIRELFEIDSQSLVYTRTVNILKSILLKKLLLNQENSEFMIGFSVFESLTGKSFLENDDFFIELLELGGIKFRVDYLKNGVFLYDRNLNEDLTVETRDLQLRIRSLIFEVENKIKKGNK